MADLSHFRLVKFTDSSSHQLIIAPGGSGGGGGSAGGGGGGGGPSPSNGSEERSAGMGAGNGAKYSSGTLQYRLVLVVGMNSTGWAIPGVVKSPKSVTKCKNWLLFQYQNLVHIHIGQVGYIY